MCPNTMKYESCVSDNGIVFLDKGMDKGRWFWAAPPGQVATGGITCKRGVMQYRFVMTGEDTRGTCR
jgi:hypothetical protein